MRPDNRIIDDTKREQARVFRIALDPKRYGLTLKAISMDADIGYDSLRNYASGETEMPLSALRRLIGVIPNELLSILMPEGVQIVSVPEGINLDEIADWAEHFAALKLAAHRADSECKEQIGPGERCELDKAVVQFPGRAAA